MKEEYSYGKWVSTLGVPCKDTDLIQVHLYGTHVSDAERSQVMPASMAHSLRLNFPFYRQVYRSEQSYKWELVDITKIIPRKMYIVRAEYAGSGGNLRTTDTYCAWYVTDDEKWCQRWPHPFPPTHMCEIPNE